MFIGDCPKNEDGRRELSLIYNKSIFECLFEINEEGNPFIKQIFSINDYISDLFIKLVNIKNKKYESFYS